MASSLRQKNELDRAIRTMERAVGMCTKAVPWTQRNATPLDDGGRRDSESPLSSRNWGQQLAVFCSKKKAGLKKIDISSHILNL